MTGTLSILRPDGTLTESTRPSLDEEFLLQNSAPRQRDPIDRVVRYLASLGLRDAERDGRLRDEVREELERAIAWAGGSRA